MSSTSPLSGTVVPAAARVVTLALSMVTTVLIAFCLSRRISVIKEWRRASVAQWLIIGIYVDSLLFIVSTTIMTKSYNINENLAICDGAVLLCLLCYMSTKVLLYYFLVEKVFIIRSPWKSRFKDKLYLFNVLGVILPYCILVVLSFIYRIAYINLGDNCIIGIDRNVLFPLVGFEIALNIYLTTLFLAPLKKLYGDNSFNNRGSAPRVALKTMAMRTFIGSCATLFSTAVNLIVLASLQGEKGWLCIMLCNLDILLAVSVLHWATSLDKRLDETQQTGATDTRNGTHAYGDKSQVLNESSSPGMRSNAMRGPGGSLTDNNGGGILRQNDVVVSWQDMELNNVKYSNDKNGIREDISDVTSDHARDVKNIV